MDSRDSGGLSFRQLGAAFGISAATAFEIYTRESMKNGTTTRVSAFIVRKYPRLAVAS